MNRWLLLRGIWKVFFAAIDYTEGMQRKGAIRCLFREYDGFAELGGGVV